MFKNKFFYQPLLPIFLLTLIVVFLFLYFFIPIELEDVWWHLATGRWIFEHAQVPFVDPFAFESAGKPWVCYHWLASSILYSIFKISGLWGLKVFRALFFVVVVGIFYFYSRRHLPFSFLLGLVVLMVLGISQRFFLKPDMFNLIFIQVFLIQLISYMHHRETKTLLIIPLLGILWFNLHLGAFIYGTALISIFLLASIVARNWTAAKDITLVLILFFGGFLINPYGVTGFLYPFQTFFSSHSSGFYNVKHVVMDLLPGTYIFQSFHYIHFHLLVLFGFVALLFIRQHRLVFVLLWVCALGSFLCVTRNSGFFTVVSLYILIEAFKQGKLRDWLSEGRRGKLINAVLALLVGCYVCVQIYGICAKKVLYGRQISSYLGFATNPVTESLIQFLNEHHISGRVFNVQPIGGELIWYGYPQLRHFIDGRFVLGVDALETYQLILNDPAKNWPVAIKRFDFNIVIMDISNDGALRFIQYLNQDKSWGLIEVKGSWVVFIKKNDFTHLDQQVLDYEENLKKVSINGQDMVNLQSLINRPYPNRLQRWLSPIPEDLDTLNSSATMMNLGYTQAGVQLLIQALLLSPQPKAIWAASELLRKR